MTVDSLVHDHNDKWDLGDINALLEARRNNMTVAQIAKSLGRTIPAVNGKIFRLRKQGVFVPSRY